MKTKHHWWGILGLILLAGLLSACDPTNYLYLVVKGVSVVDQKPYLRVSIHVSWGPGCCGEDPNNYFVSQDEGETWQELPTQPEYLPETIWLPESSHIGECVPNDPQVCYRLSNEPVVEISADGGKTWQIDWRMPPGRGLYMARHPIFIDLIKVFPDTIPYDLGVLNTEDGHVVIVAYGNQGVLVKSTSGEWDRYPVLMEPNDLGEGYYKEVFPATPLPYRATSVGALLTSLVTETGWIFLLALTWLMVLNATGWVRLSKAAKERKGKQIAWLYIFTGLLGVAFVLQLWVFITLHLHGTPQDYWDVNPLFKCICPPPVILVIIVYTLTRDKLPTIETVSLANPRAVKWTLAFFGLAWLPFGLWALGIIPHYLLAQIGAGILALLAMGLGMWDQNHQPEKWKPQPMVETSDRLPPE
jgi:hypothetical protein